MNDLPIARDLFFILASAFFGGVIAKKLRFPLIVGYLLSGIIVGSVISKQSNYPQTINNIAEIGVAFLMFTLGLEFSLTKLKTMGSIIILSSLFQIILTVLIGTIIFPLFGMSFFESLFLGAVFSLSSTAVVVKSLSDRGELDTLHGEISAGWLFMQDLYTLPIMILLPAIGLMMEKGKMDLNTVVLFLRSIFFALGSFFLIIFTGRKVVPKAIDLIVSIKSRELVLVATVSICLFFAFLFKFFGFSFAVGGFVAGILIATTSARHGIFSEIRPLRDIFSVVFFVSLGLMLNFTQLFQSFGLIILITVIVMLIKFLISGVIMTISGYHTKTSTLVSFSLVSVGEFAFILAVNGLNSHLIDQNIYMLILYVSFISLFFAAPLISGSNNIYSKIKSLLSKKVRIFSHILERLDRAHFLSEDIKGNHIIVLGYGRVGKYICRALSMENIPYLVVDYNHKIVKSLKEEGINVIYGDPSEIDVLRFAGVDSAKLVIVAYFDRSMQETLITNIFSLNNRIKIICRVHFEEDQKRLKALGVTTIIQPEFEAAVSIAEKLLKERNISSQDIDGKILRLKIEHGMN